MSDKVKIGALWENHNEKDGSVWFSGKLGDANLTVSPNQFKKEDKHPDYIVYVSKPEKKAEKKAWD